MWTNKLNVFVSLMIAVAFLATESKTQGQKLCGKALSDALEVKCAGRYNSRSERSYQEMETADYPLADDSPPFLSQARAQGMLNGPFVGRRCRRELRGIHEECCLKTCTLEELTSYCEKPEEEQ